MPQKLFQSMDSSYFKAQVARIHREGYRVIRCSADQLKVGPFSYYPSNVTIFKDGSAKKEHVRGIEAFIMTLTEAGIRKVRQPTTIQRAACAELEFTPLSQVTLRERKMDDE